MSDGAIDPGAAALALAALIYGGMLIGWGVWQVAARVRRGAGSATRTLLGRAEPPPWVQDHWACGRCRSVNPRFAERCERCRSPRSSAEITVPLPPTVPDIIPASIAAAGALVRLEHNALAHDDGLSGHWRLRVNGVIAGSAARRDGALDLLRALDGAETVYYDPRGSGTGPYPVAALIAAFEGADLPLEEPCPERVTRR